MKIKCPEDSSQKQLDKRLPLTMTVQKLKGLLQRLYKVNAMELRLSYLTEEVSGNEDDEIRRLERGRGEWEWGRDSTWETFWVRNFVCTYTHL